MPLPAYFFIHSELPCRNCETPSVCVISVTEIAEHAKISPSSLKRLFNEYPGVPVHKYFMVLKIRKAAELLQSGYTVSETADRPDFSSQSHFSKVFKDMTGINPAGIKREFANINLHL